VKKAGRYFLWPVTEAANIVSPYLFKILTLLLFFYDYIAPIILAQQERFIEGEEKLTPSSFKFGIIYSTYIL
jgi:hypothetical protein